VKQKTLARETDNWVKFGKVGEEEAVKLMFSIESELENGSMPNQYAHICDDSNNDMGPPYLS
jgi:hypothetical protein